MNATAEDLGLTAVLLMALNRETISAEPITARDLCTLAGVDSANDTAKVLFALNKSGRVIRWGEAAPYRYSINPDWQPKKGGRRAARHQPAVGQNTGSDRPDPGPAVLPASTAAAAAAPITLMNETLRTNEAVLAVLQAGGYAVTEGKIGQVGYGLATLYDASGAKVPAWQNAIKANIGPNRCRTESVGDIVRWRLP